MTIIDPITRWFKIAEIPAKSADVIADTFERMWLVRYPRPAEVIIDRGHEFMAEMQRMLRNDYGIRRKLITTRNLQANSIVERAHQTVHNLITSQNITCKKDLPHSTWAGLLSAVAFAMRATVHTTKRASPMQLVFNCDAIHNVRFEANWQYIKQRRRHVIQQNNKRENSKRTPYTYRVGDLVMVEQYQNRKYGQPRFRGPYKVDYVYDNGTLRLRHDTPRGGAIYQTWNIRQLHPYMA